MNLTSPSQVKAWCIEREFHPNKTLGQNFLIDRNVLEAIVDIGLAGAAAGEPILEIGPGLGVVTEELLRRGHPVLAIEKDPVLAAALQARNAAHRAAGEVREGDLTVIEGDALAVLKQKPSASCRAVEGNGPHPFGPLGARPLPAPIPPSACRRMVSNLPYQAGTRILLELVQRRELETMTVLLQNEVAERLAAAEGSRTRSLAGVWAQLDYDVEIVRRVSAACFWPRPEVGSAVVRLERHARNASLEEAARDLFHRLTKQAFAHRRKQLATIFRGQTASTQRAEALSNADWVAFTKGQMQHEDTRGLP